MRAFSPTRPSVRHLSWLLMAGVLVVALVVGSRSVSNQSDQDRRVAALSAQIRCPSCSDLSVADSDDPTALAVRQAIRREVAAGWPDARIEGYLVARYGQGILLDPPTSGVSVLVWALPVAIAVLAGGTVCVLFFIRRRKRDAAVAPSAPGAGDDDQLLVESALGRRGVGDL